MQNKFGWRYRQDLAKQVARKEWAICIGFLAVELATIVRFITL